MARVVESAKFVERDMDRSFDFEQYADGRIWELVEGEDFDMPARKLTARARNFAKRTERIIRVATITVLREVSPANEATGELLKAYEQPAVHLQFLPRPKPPEATNGEAAETPAPEADKPKPRKRR